MALSKVAGAGCSVVAAERAVICPTVVQQLFIYVAEFTHVSEIHIRELGESTESRLRTYAGRAMSRRGHE